VTGAMQINNNKSRPVQMAISPKSNSLVTELTV